MKYLLLHISPPNQFNSTAPTSHVLPPWRVLDADLELGEAVGVALEHALQVQLLDLPLQPRRQTRVHRRAAREHDVLVQLWGRNQ